MEPNSLSESVWIEKLQNSSSPLPYKKAFKEFFCNINIDPILLINYIKTFDRNTIENVFILAKKYIRNIDIWLEYLKKLELENEKRTFFTELFTIPRPGLDDAWKTYENWEKNLQAKEKMRELYIKTFSDWTYEEESYKVLENSQNFGLAHLKAYYQYNKDPIRRYIFEEVLRKYPNSAEIWQEYLVSELNDKSSALFICKRALRCLPNNITFWSYLILLYEDFNKPFTSKLYIGKFKKALEQAFEDASDLTRLWKEYSQSAKRSSQDQLQILIEGENWLAEYYPPQHLVLKAYRANITDNIQLFEEIVKEQGSSAAVWDVYIKYLEDKNNNKARQVYRRALEYTKDNPRMIALKYIDYENRHGTIEDVLQARVKAYKRLSRDIEPISTKGEKFKIKAKTVKTRYTAYVSNLPGNMKEHQLEDILKQISRVRAVRIVRDRKGNSRGFAYCDYESEEDLIQAVSYFNGKELQGNTLSMAVSKPPEENKNEECTLFVNNLPFEITESELCTFLSPYGGIKAIRIIKDLEGKCKGYAYAEFFDQSSVDNASQVGTITIRNRKVLLEKCSQDKEQKYLLHVSNLPYSVEESQVQTLFPNSISITLPKDKVGKSRGFAFVEFGTENEAMEILENENPTLNGRHLVIKRSYKKAAEKKALNNSDFKKFLS
ncbi:hypothetical protein SteCoe_20628 [Stentor coeruleus]|uniref:RRM domain-containing protein n=1 Tax=Stentor coeruleus TaxID=5963 RepID=A0A1R2BRR1_9CILI|nr:hypothetical protein SteCoe_20628 [Stentor coeruleus]